MSEEKKFMFSVYIIDVGKTYKECKAQLATQLSRLSIEKFKIDTGWEVDVADDDEQMYGKGGGFTPK